MAECIQVLGNLLFNPLLASIAIHGVLGAAIVAALRLGLISSSVSPIHARWLEPRWCIVASVGVVAAAGLFATVAALWFQPKTATSGSEPLAVWSLLLTVSVVPIVEEIVYRAGIGARLHRFLGPEWGFYGGAVVFSVMHSLPTVDRVLSGDVGFVSGPFLLALICDLFYRGTGSLLYPMMFHGACNLTVVVFQLVDPRLMKLLPIFY